MDATQGFLSYWEPALKLSHNIQIKKSAALFLAVVTIACL